MRRIGRFWVAIIAATALVLAAAGLATAGIGPFGEIFSSQAGQPEEEETPEPEEEETPEPEEEESPEAIPLPAEEGRAKAAQNRQNAENFVGAMKDWAACAATAAAASGNDPDFDPHVVCGPKPVDTDFGLGGDDEAEEEEEADEDTGPPPGTPGGPPADAGPPEGSGPSAGSGAPEGAGPPADAGPPGS